MKTKATALGLYTEIDYGSKLAPSEREWLKQFNREYYLGFGLKEPQTIHPTSYHKQLFKDAHRRRDDALNCCRAELDAEVFDLELYRRGPPQPKSTKRKKRSA